MASKILGYGRTNKERRKRTRYTPVMAVTGSTIPCGIHKLCTKRPLIQQRNSGSNRKFQDLSWNEEWFWSVPAVLVSWLSPINIEQDTCWLNRTKDGGSKSIWRHVFASRYKTMRNSLVVLCTRADLHTPPIVNQRRERAFSVWLCNA